MAIAWFGPVFSCSCKAADGLLFVRTNSASAIRADGVDRFGEPSSSRSAIFRSCCSSSVASGHGNLPCNPTAD